MDEEMQEMEGEVQPPAVTLQEILAVPNIASVMADRQLVEIGHEAIRSFDMDRESMADWLAKMQKAIDLAQLVKSEKTYPFEKASNIKYPLVTSAALQFNARAYPAIVPSDNIVKCRIWGRDVGGKKAARGERVSSFMSWSGRRIQTSCSYSFPSSGTCFARYGSMGTARAASWSSPAR